MDDAALRDQAIKRRLQVAIDGPAGAGKSTVGRGVASRLNCAFLDTGLMYRAVAWLALEEGVPPSDAPRLTRIAAAATFESTLGHPTLVVNGVPRLNELRSAQVDAIVSEVSAHSQVRRELVTKQREFAGSRCVVMVGRDIGTTVLPNAEVKLWITASAEERARRRLSERLAGGTGISVAAMADRIRKRDAIDASRETSPLRRADDAIEIVTDDLDADASVEASMSVLRRVLIDMATP